MSVTASSVENLAAFTADTVRALSASRNEPEWMLQKRLDAFAIYEQLPMPARTDEEWRRTDLRMLKPEHFAIETALQTQSGTLETILSGSEHQMQFGA
ncbi:MAG: hypothetical protein M9953_11940, partial [Thermomicrobiales bacterium]|nr:hypothetical protein [Thermomicrobiales bacterium]